MNINAMVLYETLPAKHDLYVTMTTYNTNMYTKLYKYVFHTCTYFQTFTHGCVNVCECV